MIEFMFGVLGSGVFWILFFIVGFFAGTLVLKRVAKKTYRFITTGEGHGWYAGQVNGMSLVIILLAVYLFWPVILTALAIGLIVKHVFWKSFCNGVKGVDSIIPDIQFKKKEDTE